MNNWEKQLLLHVRWENSRSGFSWIEYSPAAVLGRTATDAERKALRRAADKLAAAGLVTIQPNDDGSIYRLHVNDFGKGNK